MIAMSVGVHRRGCGVRQHEECSITAEASETRPSDLNERVANNSTLDHITRSGYLCHLIIFPCDQHGWQSVLLVVDQIHVFHFKCAALVA